MLELIGFIWESWWHLLLNVLVAINSVVYNPGIAIIIFTVFIRLLTVPLTMKSLRSSRNMQQIQPLIKEIQKKYAKDRAKQQEETMKIYQQYGVNPMAGCLPMLVTMPILFGLYSALTFVVQQGPNSPHLHDLLIKQGWQVYQFYHLHNIDQLRATLLNASWISAANFNQPFLWVASLGVPDPIYVLPVLSGIFQFIQSRMAMPLRDPSQPLDSQTKMMQNMMQFAPIYILPFSLSFPAGTVLYWATSGLFGAVQQYFITGFGSLPTVPGLGFLPRKQVVTPTEAPPPPDITTARPARKGVMGWMMDKALQAQEAQKAGLTQTQTQAAQPSGITDGASTVRLKGKGKGSASNKGKGSEQEQEHQVKTVPTTTMKYASDLKHRGNASGNGVERNGHGPVAGAPLPRKRRGKK